MDIHTLTLGNFQTNCYILSENGHCAVIDPGYEPEKLLAVLAHKALALDAILLTHGHFDHVGAVEALIAATGCALYMHRTDHCQPAIYKMLYPLTGRLSPIFVEEGDTVPMGLTVLETPGHTPGSVCYLAPGVLFTGDTLFCGACGRTDLPGGNGRLLKESLNRLAQLEENYLVYPGHGESTDLAGEKRYNPYL